MTRVTLWDDFVSPGFLGVLGGVGLIGLLIPALIAVTVFVGILRTIEVAKNSKTAH